MQERAWIIGGPIALGLLVVACGDASEQPAGPPTATESAIKRSCKAVSSRPVQIKGGTFVMGSDAVYAEEGPARETRVDGFWIDPHEVTNRQFAEFADATRYVTVAEKPVDPAQFGVPVERIPAYMLEPGSAVFTPPARPSRTGATHAAPTAAARSRQPWPKGRAELHVAVPGAGP